MQQPLAVTRIHRPLCLRGMGTTAQLWGKTFLSEIWRHLLVASLLVTVSAALCKVLIFVPGYYTSEQQGKEAIWSKQLHVCYC